MTHTKRDAQTQHTQTQEKTYTITRKDTYSYEHAHGARVPANATANTLPTTHAHIVKFSRILDAPFPPILSHSLIFTPYAQRELKTLEFSVYTSKVFLGFAGLTHPGYPSILEMPTIRFQ